MKRYVVLSLIFLIALVCGIFAQAAFGQCKAIPAEVKLSFIESKKAGRSVEQLAVMDEAQQLIPLLEKADTRSKDFLTTKLGKRVIRLYGAIKANFTDEEAVAIFEKFRDGAEAAGGFELPKTTNEAGNCGCSTTWTWCGSGKHCHTEENLCDAINDCGPGGYFQCNGQCRDAHIELVPSFHDRQPDPSHTKKLKSKTPGFGGRGGREISHEIQHEIGGRKGG